MITEMLIGIVGDPVVNIITAVVALASAICAVTPTPKPGSLRAKIYKVIEVLALNIGKAKK